MYSRSHRNFIEYNAEPQEINHTKYTNKEKQQTISRYARGESATAICATTGMHKVRLSQNNYQLVAENSGQSPEVLMSNYNEALESEKRTLSLMVETSFYEQEVEKPKTQAATTDNVEAIVASIQQNPALYQQILQTLLLGANNAKQDIISAC